MSCRPEPALSWQLVFHSHNPTLVCFRAYSGEALVAEHQSRWLGPARGWDPQFWRPSSPPLPPAFLSTTETLLRHGRSLATDSRL